MPLRFRKHHISDERYESAGVFDVDNDGVLDIVSGAWWYRGPDFTERHRVGDVHAVEEYYDDFSTVPLDVNGDGNVDFITGGWWGGSLRWRENPGDSGREWPEHVVAETNCIETTRAWDIDGDGVVEIVPNFPGWPLIIYDLILDEQGKGTGRWEAHTIHQENQGHGLGYGDISGSGQGDFVLARGWLEAPPDPYGGTWQWHPDFDLGSASVPIIVADVNRDGLNDLIVGQSHAYGLDWWEQRMTGGKRQWVKHPIDPYNSQYHDMRWVDIDGDGECELVTGKRYRAHCGKDPGADDPIGIYYFKRTGGSFVKQVIDYGPAGTASGLGIHFDMADLTGNGLPDIVAPGKDGLYVFFNEG